jgi:hypothetical protein
MRSIHGRWDSVSKNAPKQARSQARWLSGACSSAAPIAARRSALIRRTTAAKMSAFDAKCA